MKRFTTGTTSAKPLAIRLAEARDTGIEEADLYTETYLVQDSPILQCVRHRGPTPPCR